MARPRIFISSTYYDLKSVRDDLDRFLRNLGYEPVRHETSQISYGHEEALEEYAYKEIDSCDILVCIIGGRAGAKSSKNLRTITQNEVMKAKKTGKQIYIFIEENVYHEQNFYRKNKNNKDIIYSSVDSAEIHEFIEEIYNLQSGNPIFPFRVSSDITDALREQMAGLFQRLMSESTEKKRSDLFENLHNSLKTVEELIKFLNAEKGAQNENFNQILFSNHPVFTRLTEIAGLGFRVVFNNIDELNDLLSNARGYRRIYNEHQHDSGYVWMRKSLITRDEYRYVYLIFNEILFDSSGNLKSQTEIRWNNNLITREVQEEEPKESEYPDEIPF